VQLDRSASEGQGKSRNSMFPVQLGVSQANQGNTSFLENLADESKGFGRFPCFLSLFVFTENVGTGCLSPGYLSIVL